MWQRHAIANVDGHSRSRYSLLRFEMSMTNAEPKYKWKRYWCPTDGRMSFEDGFLAAYEDPRVHRRLSDVVTFDEIDHNACLLLLGEPGMGKSTVVAQLAHKLSPDPDNIVDKGMLIDLRFNRNPENELFNHPDFLLWTQGGCYLRLFVDSLDECVRKDFALGLIGKLRLGPVENLRLRIACRTAELPPFLEDELRKLWSGKEAVGKYELAPLRKQDVEHAAGTDAVGFLEQVKLRGAAALAAKPITLEFLLEQYRRHRQLPQRRWDLFRDGCRILCEEPSNTRNYLNPQRTGAARERLATATRVAAVCLFAQRSAIQLTPNLGLPEDVVHCDDIAEGIEDFEGMKIPVTPTLIRETVAMSLFNARPDDRMGFAHQTYAEFLAALFLKERKLDVDKMMSILAPRGKVVPALREVAAWFASQDTQEGQWLRTQLLTTEPQILLQSDMGMAGADEKKKLVNELLERIERRELDEFDLHVGFKHLAHPELAAQLDNIIESRNESFRKRRAAILIASECGLAGLQKHLADIALCEDATTDEKEGYWLRCNALRALVVLQRKDAVNDATLDLLRPLARGVGATDPEDELKGYALQALWRKGGAGKRLTAQEFFACLTPMQNDMYFGAYFQFLTSNPLDLLDDGDLPEAIQWAATRAFEYGEQVKLQELADDIVFRAWQCILNNPTILGALVKLAWRRFKEHDDLWYRARINPGRELSNDEHKRRFVQAFVEHTEMLPYEYQILRRHGLLPPNDILWMIECLNDTQAAEQRRRWSMLITDAYRWVDASVEVIEAILKARNSHNELQETLGPYFICVNLDDPVIQKEREQWFTLKRGEQKREERKKSRPRPKPAAEQIAFCLDRLDAGELDWFWQLPFMLWQEGEAMSWNGSDADLTLSPGWKNANTKDRDRILDAAQVYLSQKGPVPDEWLGKRITYWPAVAGYLAFWLLHRERPLQFGNLGADIWKRWASIVMSHQPGLASQGEIDTRDALVKRAYEIAPRECLDAMNVLLDAEKSDEHSSDPSRIFNTCWDAQIGTFLLNKAKDPTVGAVVFGILLEQTLQQKTPGAREYAQSLLRLPLPKEANAQPRIKAAGAALLRATRGADWPLIWPILQDAPDFGRELMLETVAGVGPQPRHLWRDISANDAADAYLWLVQQFPPNEDKNMFSGRMTAVTRRDDLAWARNELPMVICEQGTWEAVAAMERIARELPHADWVPRLLAKAREYATQKSWQRLDVSDVLYLGRPNGENAQAWR